MTKRTRISLTLLTTALVFLANVPTQSGRKHGDVENIGNRDINGKVALIFPNFISLEKEIQLGAQYAQQIEQTARLVEDPVVNEYVDGLGQLIVKNSDAKVPFVIRVLDSEEVNAFALPGGYFFVNKGLILEAEDEAELAGVMAHEIAHVTARHATERMTKGNLMQFAALPALILTGGWTQYALYQGLGMGMNLAVLASPASRRPKPISWVPSISGTRDTIRRDSSPSSKRCRPRTRAVPASSPASSGLTPPSKTGSPR